MFHHHAGRGFWQETHPYAMAEIAITEDNITHDCNAEEIAINFKL